MINKPRKLLCYPNIEPDIAWLKRVLLVTDEVVRIVPKDSSDKTSPDFQRFCDVVPGSISDVQPDTDVTTLNTGERKRVEKAFAAFAASSHHSGNNTVEEDGRYQVGGFSLLHHSKFSYEMRDLLEEYNLLRPDLNSLAEVTENEGFGFVDERASSLVMSLLADKIARREKWHTITDNAFDFTVNSLNALEKPSRPYIEGAIAECLIGIAIPEDVANLDLKSYRELRNSYSDLRSLYHRFAIDFAKDQDIVDALNLEDVQQRLTELSQDLRNEMDAYHKTAFGKKIGRWTRLSFVQLSQLIASIGVGLNSPSLPSTLAVAVVNILSQTLLPQSSSEDNEEKLICRLCHLEGRIEKNMLNQLL